MTGVPVIADDGTYPKTPGRETALAGPGLVLIVWEIESDGLVDATEAGLAAHDVYTPVVIEENPTVCRADAGVKIEAEKALQYVLEDLSGKPAGRSALCRDGSALQEFREGQRCAPDRGQREPSHLRVMNRMLDSQSCARLGGFVRQLAQRRPSDPVAPGDAPRRGGLPLRHRRVVPHGEVAATGDRANRSGTL